MRLVRREQALCIITQSIGHYRLGGTSSAPGAPIRVKIRLGGLPLPEIVGKLDPLDPIF